VVSTKPGHHHTKQEASTIFCVRGDKKNGRAEGGLEWGRTRKRELEKREVHSFITWKSVVPRVDRHALHNGLLLQSLKVAMILAGTKTLQPHPTQNKTKQNKADPKFVHDLKFVAVLEEIHKMRKKRKRTNLMFGRHWNGCEEFCCNGGEHAHACENCLLPVQELLS
jgi:hypothetical protein